MAIVVQNANKPALLNWLLEVTSTPENLTLHLFTNNYSVTASDTTSSYTEASFTGYSSQTLSRAGWSAATGTTGTATANYASTLTWTNSGVSSVTIYGYYVTGATNTTTVYFSETYGSSRTLATSDVLNFTPQLQLV